MSGEIEIYVRQSGDRNLLTLHIPERLREAFIAALRAGSFGGKSSEMQVELSVLPEWVTDEDQRDLLLEDGFPIHVRIPIAEITASYAD